MGKAAGAGPAPTDKCTWAASATEYAPTFALGAGTDALGITTANWVIHSMEYTTANAAYDSAVGSLREAASGSGWPGATAGVTVETYLPYFAMPGEQYATLRTWYGYGGPIGGTPTKITTGALKDQQANWYAPGQNSFSNTAANSALVAEITGQAWGNVANMPASTYFSGSTVAANSGSTYGALGSAAFDFRVVRYFPAQVAVSVWNAGNSLLTAYNAAVTSYTAAKTTWDAYVAILEKNAKMDAFAAAFSPPKAPTVPPLPNLPWVPAAYSGYVKQTAAEYATMLANSGATGATLASGAQPTAQQFWTDLGAAQSLGGWGSFTAQLFTYRPFSKSFGTIGYSGDANATALSAVWKPQWTCGAASTAASSSPCVGLYTPTSTTVSAGLAPSTAAANNTATRLMVVVSLWSLGNNYPVGTAAGTWEAVSSLSLTW